VCVCGKLAAHSAQHYSLAEWTTNWQFRFVSLFTIFMFRYFFFDSFNSFIKTKAAAIIKRLKNAMKPACCAFNWFAQPTSQVVN